MTVANEEGKLIPLSAEEIREQVSKDTQILLKKSVILKKEKEEELPHFAFHEMSKGKVLGSGSFGTVWEITKVTVPSKPGGAKPGGDAPKSANASGSTFGDTDFKSSFGDADFNEDADADADANPADDEADNDDDDDDDHEARKFIADSCLRENTNEARYAIKILKSDVVADPSLFLKGCVDLAMEANFLSNFVHPNIIKVRGAGNKDLIGTKDYFLVMDRLYDTLENRMDAWKVTNKKLSGPSGIMKKSQKKEFVQERLHIAFELSAALNYMHARNIIYRDLKPENLGFDIRGDIKVFDLGLAKELTPDMKCGLDEESGTEIFNLTGKTGTLIYMAPEVVRMEPYCLKADVYSFAILLWEFFHLKEPFPKCTAKIHEKMVCRGSLRPKIDKKVPAEVQSLITESWSKQMGKRPNMKSVNLRLKREVQKMQGDGVEGGNMDFTRRRSTFVFRGSKGKK